MTVGHDQDGVTLLTMSFSRDFELCQLLCRTVDDMVARDINHVLAVPSSDMKLFSSLRNSRRTILAEEDLLPNWLKKIPVHKNWLTQKLKLTKRNIYFSYRGLPVRGWIAQQLMKLNAAEQVRTEIIVHADSDIAFVRPVERSTFIVDGKTPLLRFPGQSNTPAQRPWHRFAATALGLPKQDYFGSGFISNCVPWRRAVVKAMMERIATRTGEDATVFLSRAQHLSEYILYGIFCEFVQGIEASGHFATDRQLCKTLWSSDDEGAAGVDAMFKELGDEVAIGIQSTILMPIERRRMLVNQLHRKLAT